MKREHGRDEVELLWRLVRGDQEARAEVRSLGEIGLELVFLWNGEMAATKVFRRHEIAQLQPTAEGKRAELEAKGWIVRSDTPALGDETL